jgi:hypothetical protein
MLTSPTPFTAGQLVQRKAGVPVMEYLRRGELGQALCSWTEEGHLITEGFTFTELRLATLARLGTALSID